MEDPQGRVIHITENDEVSRGRDHEVCHSLVLGGRFNPLSTAARSTCGVPIEASDCAESEAEFDW